MGFQLALVFPSSLNNIELYTKGLSKDLGIIMVVPKDTIFDHRTNRDTGMSNPPRVIAEANLSETVKKLKNQYRSLLNDVSVRINRFEWEWMVKLLQNNQRLPKTVTTVLQISEKEQVGRFTAIDIDENPFPLPKMPLGKAFMEVFTKEAQALLGELQKHFKSEMMLINKEVQKLSFNPSVKLQEIPYIQDYIDRSSNKHFNDLPDIMKDVKQYLMELGQKLDNINLQFEVDAQTLELSKIDISNPNPKPSPIRPQ